MDLFFSHARSAVLARNAILEAIHGYKYRGGMWFEGFLGGLLAETAGPILAGQGWDCLVPVPLYPARQREREFNQAERLGRYLERSTEIPMNCQLLRRVLPTPTQTRLSREEREQNVRKAFALKRKASLNGERIVVIDDVFTTGATTNACARVLREAGAWEVCVWTVARGI